MSLIYNWFPWISGLSIVALGILAIFAPSFLQVAGNWLSALTPLIKWAAETLTGFLDVLLEGAKDMLDNWKSIVFVATVAATAGWMFHTSTEKCFDKVRKDWKLTPRTSVTKVVKEEDPLSTFFKQFGIR